MYGKRHSNSTKEKMRLACLKRKQKNVVIDDQSDKI